MGKRRTMFFMSLDAGHTAVRREGRLRQKLRRRFSEDGDFDADWYRKRYADVAGSSIDPFDHYLDHGWREGRFPNAVFDTSFYLRRNPDVAASGINPLVHYVKHGAEEGRDPNPWFDTAYYLSRIGGRLGGKTPAAHYLRQASGEKIVPTKAFDAALFRRQCPAVAGEVDAYCAFLHVSDAVAHGCLGDCLTTYVTGWACRNAGPPVNVTIRINGIERGTVSPWLRRADIAALGLNPVAGFFFSLPQRLAPGDVVEALDERGAQLQGSPHTYAVAPLAPEVGFIAARATIAHGFLHGRGLEIGAFTQPTDTSQHTTVEYFDKFPAPTLRKLYDENCGRPLVEPHYHGDAQTLQGVPEGQVFDFVIANHVIEHLEDPILFMKALVRFIKPGGRAMLSAPNMRFTFDAGRDLTTFDHLARDHRDGAALSRKAHYLEWVERLEGLTGPAAVRRAEALDLEDFSIHFHV